MKPTVFAALLFFLVQALAAKPDVKVILLGTGGPEITADRAGFSTLIEIDSELLLFDTGRGVLQRLYETQVDPTQIRKIFFTHLHNDHIEGLPNLWITPWFLLGRDHGFELWGPPGQSRTIKGMRLMYHFDLENRVNAFNDLEDLETRVREIEGAGQIVSADSYQVTAVPVEHGDGNPAFGYVVEGDGWKVVLSGDCTYTPALAAASQDADVIIHNVIALSPRLAAKPEMKGVLAKLATPQDVARIMSEAKPKLAVLSHIVKKELSGSEGDQFIIDAIREHGYQGPLLMGHDRIQIEIGETVDVIPPPPLDDLPDLDKKSYEKQ